MIIQIDKNKKRVKLYQRQKQQQAALSKMFIFLH